MLLNLTCFIALVLIIATRLYESRKFEKRYYKGKLALTMEEIGDWWKKYKVKVNNN